MSFTTFKPGDLLRFNDVEEDLPNHTFWKNATAEHEFVYLISYDDYGIRPWERKRNGYWQVLNLLYGTVSHLSEKHLLMYYTRLARFSENMM